MKKVLNEHPGTFGVGIFRARSGKTADEKWMPILIFNPAIRHQNQKLLS